MSTLSIPVQCEPYNATTGTYYSGGNIERLLDANYESPQWATYKQWQSIGYQVRKGERSTKIAVYGSSEAESVAKSDKPRQSERKGRASFARAYSVFNREQVEKIEDDQMPALPESMQAVHRATDSKPAQQASSLSVNQRCKEGMSYELLAEYYAGCAESLQAKADAKLAPRLDNTPKRQRQASSARYEGLQLERAAQLARALESLATIKGTEDKHTMKYLQQVTKRRVEQGQGYYGLIFEGEGYYDESIEAKALRLLLDSEPTAAQKQAEQANKLSMINRIEIDGFFPTPEPILEQLTELLGSELMGKTVLEPSAGTGNLAHWAQDMGAIVDCWEIQPTLAKYINDGGFLSCKVTDCLMEMPKDHKKYDYIIMNPPYERKRGLGYQWQAHIDHMRQFLKHDGELWAIIPQGADFNGQYSWDVEGTPFANTNIKTKIVKVLA